MMMRVIDLSRTIEPGMPCYPGTPQPVFRSLSSIDQHGFAEQQLTFSSHAGTHVDLPSHIIPGGNSLDALSLDLFTGKGFALDLRASAAGTIHPGVLQCFEAHIQECDFLLLYSGWSQYWGGLEYYTGYPVLSPDTAQWLTGFHLKGIGVDMISVDPPDSIDFSVHSMLLRSGILIIENLADLSPLLNTSFTFCCFPLKIAQAEASPLRAVAFVDDANHT
jgi:kynurenine formamidase